MRISDKHIKELQKLLKDLYGLEYTEEQAQQAGLAIMRFVLSKEQRNREQQLGASGLNTPTQ